MDDKTIEHHSLEDKLSSTTETGYKEELKRSFDLKALVVFGLVTISPIGPMLVYGEITPASGGMPSLAYVFGLIAMLFPAICYVRMSKEFPIAGGIYSFVQRGTGNPFLAFIIGWVTLVDYALVPACLCAFGGAWLNMAIPAIPVYVWTWLFLLTILLINSRGVKITSRANFVLFGIEVLAILIFVIFAIKYTIVDGGGLGGFSVEPFFQADTFSFTAVSGATAIAIFSFLGYDALATMSEDTLNPKKTVGRAMMIVLVILTVLFILQSYFAYIAHPEYADLSIEAAWLEIMQEIGGDFNYLLWLATGILAFSLALTMNVQSAASRLLYAMARDDTLPASGFLAKISSKSKVPFNAMIVITLVNGVAALLPPNLLVHLINFGAIIAFMFINVTVFIYFFIRKKERGGAGMLRNLLIPAIGAALMTWLLVNLGNEALLLGGCWIVLGIVIIAVKTKGFKEAPPVMKGL
jgi:amino acid transporter